MTTKLTLEQRAALPVDEYGHRWARMDEYTEIPSGLEHLSGYRVCVICARVREAGNHNRACPGPVMTERDTETRDRDRDRR